MKRILLVGKLNNNTRELFERLSRRFQVQVSAEKTESVQGMIEVTSPDMVLLNVMEYEDIDDSVLGLLENTYGDIPVLVFGTQASCNRYKPYFEREQFVELNRPVSQDVLMQCCYQMTDGAGTAAAKHHVNAEQEMKKILVVDDSPVTLRGIKAMLDKDYQIAVATSGEQALQSLKKRRPDLILLDYEMPGLDGRETLEKIREDKEISNIPVIFLTGVADKEHIAAVLKLNPAGYFLKPAERERLIGAIEEVLSGADEEI